MKPSKKLIAAAFAALAMTGAQAADNHSITVRADVAGTCKFQSATSQIDLTVDPSAAGNATGNGSIIYRCTKGTTPVFGLQSGSTSSTTGGNLSLAGETIPYTFSSTSGGNGTGMGAGQDKTLGVTVTVNQANAADVTPGIYTDTIAITLNP